MTANRVLVVGATGFVGRAISTQLRDSGWLVRAAARRSQEGPWEEFVELDVSAPPETWPIEGIDSVVHAAGLAHDIHGSATSAADHYRVNAKGTANAADAARQGNCSRLVLISSVKAMADKTLDGPLIETSACHPTTPYGIAKLRGEQLAARKLHGSACSLAIVRLTPVYGKGAKGNLSRLLHVASKRWFPLLPAHSGERSMIHVDDVAAMVSTVLHTEAAGLFIGEDGHRYSPRRIQECARQALAIDGYALSLPGAPISAVGSFLSRRGGGSICRRFEADLSRLLDASLFDGSMSRERLRWQPKHSLWSTFDELLTELP